MNQPKPETIRKAKVNATEYLDLMRVLARVHREFLDDLPGDGANPDEHVWKYLGERVLVEESE